jgi:hypothetical protein
VKPQERWQQQPHLWQSEYRPALPGHLTDYTSLHRRRCHVYSHAGNEVINPAANSIKVKRAQVLLIVLSLEAVASENVQIE